MSYSANDGSDKALQIHSWKEQRDGLVLSDAESDQRQQREGEGKHFRSSYVGCTGGGFDAVPKWYIESALNTATRRCCQRAWEWCYTSKKE